MTSSLGSHTARLLVKPAPTTLHDSLSILKRLQSFGEVTSFFNPQYEPRPTASSRGDGNTTILATFATSDSLESVLKSTPLTVESNANVQDAKEADPFNIRGLQDRHPLSKRTFKCHIYTRKEAEERHKAIVRSNPFSGAFQVDQLSPIFADLKQSGAQLDGLSAIFSTVTIAPRGDNEPVTLDPSPQSLKFMWTAAQRARTTGTLPLQQPQPAVDDVLAYQHRRRERRRLRRAAWKRRVEAKFLQVQRQQTENRRSLLEELAAAEEWDHAEEHERDDITRGSEKNNDDTTGRPSQ